MKTCYIRKIKEGEVDEKGKLCQLSFSSTIAEPFFRTKSTFMDDKVNVPICVFHHLHTEKPYTIELQPATDSRFSTKLGTLLLENGEHVEVGDILLFSDFRKAFILRVVKRGTEANKEYSSLIEANKKERHIYLYLDESIESNEDNKDSIEDSKCNCNIPLQQIFYGAPGTGKSFRISRDFPTNDDNTFRTTFHPDTDYASFVGSYKPIMKNKKQELEEKEYTVEKLKELYKEFKETVKERQEIRFTARYYSALEKLSSDDRKSVFEGSTDSVVSAEITKGIAAAKEIVSVILNDNEEISYSFTPQVFTNAYIKAWQYNAENKPVYLVIDEINRGNCAQIFGDLFQLLDRDDYGYSEYEIKPDVDLETYIKSCKLSVSGVKDKNSNDISESINNGKLLKLPNNLNILATMNTSDQSLFPMDSAFKRRWDWEYVRIDYSDANTIKIKFSDDEEYSWGEFIKFINGKIKDATSSADKKLGNRFVHVDDKQRIITLKQFVNKVIFYLWSDIYKDMEKGDDGYIFGNVENFESFFEPNDESDAALAKMVDGINLEKVRMFITQENVVKNLHSAPKTEDEDEKEEEKPEEESAE